MVYRTIDIYDGFEILYKGTCANAAKRARRQRQIDTDDECCVFIEERVLNEEGDYEWKVNNVI